MSEPELKDAASRMMLYFDLGVLASYRQDAHRYEVSTDNFEGTVTLRSDFYQTLSDAERKSQYLHIQFGFRATRDGSLAIAAWGPDFAKAGEEQRKKWVAFHVTSESFPEEFDARFNLWVQRYLAGSWEVENGPLDRLVSALSEMNSLALEAVGRTIFKSEERGSLVFPYAENDAAYADAHSALYGLVIDGLDKTTIAAIAGRLAIAGQFGSDKTLQALRKIVSDAGMQAAIFDSLELVSKNRRVADHGVRAAASPFAAFDQFSKDAEAVVAGLVVLRDFLSKSLNLDVTHSMQRRQAKSALPRIDVTRVPQPNYSIVGIAKIVGKTVEKVEFGFRDPIAGVHDSELIILHFTDGSIMGIDTGSNAANLSSDHEVLKPEDFHSSFILNFVPPPSTRDRRP